MKQWIVSLLLCLPTLAYPSHCDKLNVALFNNAHHSLVVINVFPEEGSTISNIQPGQVIPSGLAKFMQIQSSDESKGDAEGLIKLAEQDELDKVFILKYSCEDHFLGVTFQGHVLAEPDEYKTKPVQWAGGFNFSTILIFDINMDPAVKTTTHDG